MSTLDLIIENYIFRDEYDREFLQLAGEEYIEKSNKYSEMLKNLKNKYGYEVGREVESICNDYADISQKTDFKLGFQLAAKLFKELNLTGGDINE